MPIWGSEQVIRTLETSACLSSCYEPMCGRHIVLHGCGWPKGSEVLAFGQPYKWVKIRTPWFNFTCMLWFPCFTRLVRWRFRMNPEGQTDLMWSGQGPHPPDLKSFFADIYSLNTCTYWVNMPAHTCAQRTILYCHTGKRMPRSMHFSKWLWTDIL